VTRAVWLQRLTPFDRKLVLLLLLVVLLTFLFPLRQGLGERVVVSSGAQIRFVAPLDQDQQFELSGPLGMTRLQIGGGGVRVLSSPCPKKICIGMGEARHSGDLLACVPNRLVIRIEGGAPPKESYDLLSR
jgi:hypothetical protein